MSDCRVVDRKGCGGCRFERKMDERVDRSGTSGIKSDRCLKVRETASFQSRPIELQLGCVGADFGVVKVDDW